MQNWQNTVISQYGSSPVMLAMLGSINAALDPTANINAFYNLIWNVSTAQGYGLDVWGRIVGVTRVLNVATGVNFGFTGPAGNSGDSFNVAPFYQAGATTANYALSDPAFLTLIYAKALANITNGSIQSINSILMTLFGTSGHAWCTDGENMTMTYTFDFTPSPVQLAIISQSGVLPRPPGIALSIVHP